jgi:surfeit locus 1 family protein
VPDAQKKPDSRSEGRIQGLVEVRGLIRTAGRPGLFTPSNDARGNLWYWPDASAMSLQAFGDADIKTMPFRLDADREPLPPGGLPRGGVTRLALPNRHLEYALTWYGLGLALIGVYIAYVIGRLGFSSSA